MIFTDIRRVLETFSRGGEGEWYNFTTEYVQETVFTCSPPTGSQDEFHWINHFIDRQYASIISTELPIWLIVHLSHLTLDNTPIEVRRYRCIKITPGPRYADKLVQVLFLEVKVKTTGTDIIFQSKTYESENPVWWLTVYTDSDPRSSSQLTRCPSNL